MSSSQVHHPVFARVFNRLSETMEREIGHDRDDLLAGLSGRVVEIGAGNGGNFRHYPQTVREVIAVEPEPYLRHKAQGAASQAPVSVQVHDAVAGELPLESASCDAAVASLVLCTVPDVPGSLAELRRVLKPGGELRFIEHVRSDNPRRARLQLALDRSGIWPLVGGGCHCGRATLQSIEGAGFRIQHARRLDLGPSCLITHPHLIGAAIADHA